MSKRRITGICLAILTCAVCATGANAALKDGTYETQAMGNNGNVVFKTTIRDGKIASVEVLKSEETPLLGQGALEKLSKAIVEQQSLKIDAVSGASNSSRAILKAVGEALAKAGGSEADLKPVKVKTSDKAILQDATTDVLVIGAGGSGMAAAIEATNQGAKVILIEKQPNVGGTTLFSTTSFTAGGSKQQMAAPKPFTAEDFYKKLLVEFPGAESPNLKQLAERSGPTIDWLINLGADLTKVINNSQHVSPSGKALGTIVVPTLKKEVDRLGIDTRTQTKAVDLITKDGKVIGAVVETPKGKYKIFADSVILSTGGFASNPELVAKYTPQWAGYPSTASRGSTGDGLLMGMKVGGAISHMDVAGP